MGRAAETTVTKPSPTRCDDGLRENPDDGVRHYTVTAKQSRA
jgi:hypothetical protein